MGLSRNTKLALIVVGALGVMCVGVCLIGFLALQRLGQQFGSGETARRVGAEIADYSLPSGYAEQAGMDLFMYKMVVIAPREIQATDGLIFMLIGTSAHGMSQAEMERQMQQVFQQQYNPNGGRTIVIGQERVVIRGREVTLTLSETESRVPLRQAVGAFEGKNGLVIVMVMGNSRQWDDSLMRDFLGSIK
jgi:hypothetical protein